MAKKEESVGGCKHINKHYVNVLGEREDLICELAEGHEGEHQALYGCLRISNGERADDKLKRVTVGGREYIVKEEMGYWSDGAGIPVEEVKPDLEQLSRIRQRVVVQK